MQYQSHFTGPLMIVHNAIPQMGQSSTQEGFLKSYLKNLLPKTFTHPLYLVFQALPQYKVKSKSLSYYDQEVAGYFQLEAIEDLLNLEKDNVYIPKFPVTAKNEIDLENLKSIPYVATTFFTGDSVLKVGEDLISKWDFYELATKNFKMAQSEKEGPKVLIFHTHVHEYFKGEKGSSSGEVDINQGVAAVGEELALLLEKQYGLETLHVTDSFYATPQTTGTDKLEYDRMEPIIEAIIEANPTIEIVIDLHRDAVNGTNKFVTELSGKQTAQLMIVNGICMRRDAEDNLVENSSLKNPYLEDNLAFSIQTQIQGLTYYPGLMRKIYLKPYRYSTHMKAKSLLIELGNQNNTLEEALNAAAPLADMIAKVVGVD
jgi:stage II sporulation protein P